MNMELPEELMTMILSKLPVKSLLRFKCVQKSWHSLISSPYFVRLHRSSINKNNSFFVRRHYFYDRPPHERHVLSLHSYETLEEDLNSQINIPFSIVGFLKLCGSCDGLVCLSNREDKIVICNPTIREFRSLFVPGSGFRIDSVAFGSNPNTGRYTVVMIGLPNSDKACEDDRETRLYDFSTDTWRKTAVVIPGPFEYSHRAISLNGAFHWCPGNISFSKNILMFHMSNEVTGFIPLPDFARVSHYKELCVSSKSQLSLSLYDPWGGRLEISVMTEYGVKESWTRLDPIAYWDEQRLLLRSARGQLLSCDLQNHQNLLYFPIQGGYDLSPYSQSLVSVNGIEKHSVI